MGSVSIGPNQRVVRMTDVDILTATAMYKTHRDYVAKLFRDIGFEVTEWHSKTVGDIQGLQYYKSDSDVVLTVEVVGTIGVNIRPIRELEAVLAGGNKIQTEGPSGT